MAEVNISAKIEEALVKIQPAKKRGQFGIWADDIDDFIIATIKNYPEIDLGFVDKLAKTTITTGRPRTKRRSNYAVGGCFVRSVDALRKLPTQFSIGIGGGGTIDEAQVAEGIETAMTYLDDTSSVVDKKEKDLKTRKTIFHELDHVVSSQEYYLKSIDGEFINYFNVDQNKKIDIKGLEENFEGDLICVSAGLPRDAYRRIDGRTRDASVMATHSKLLEEGETDLLAKQQMKQIYPNYQEDGESLYSMFSLITEAGDLLFDDVFKKAYYGGYDEIKNKENDESFKQYMELCNNFCKHFEWYQVQINGYERFTNEPDFSYSLDLLEAALQLQDFIYIENTKKRFFDKSEKSFNTARRLDDITRQMCDGTIWESILEHNYKDKVDAAINAMVFSKVVEKNLEKLNYNMALAFDNKEQYIPEQEQRIKKGTPILTEEKIGEIKDKKAELREKYKNLTEEKGLKTNSTELARVK